MLNKDLKGEGMEQLNEPSDESIVSEQLPEIKPEVAGEPLSENKEELEKIIERNRLQVEQNDGIIEEQEAVEKRVESSERLMAEQFDKEKVETPTPPKRDDDDEKNNIKKHAQEVYQIDDPQQQIDKIVQLAITKDPYYAVKVAQHLDDNYILNEVHDRLVEDQVREELIKRKLLKEL